MKEKTNLNDGCNSELVLGATFTRGLEIPIIEAPKKIIIPEGIIPFSKIKYSNNKNEAIGFFEMDEVFAEIFKNPYAFVKTFNEYAAIISVDASLYRDAPLSVQITNLYRNRAIGSFYQRNGSYVVPLIRWGNEYTYTTIYFPEPIAFLGAPKHSIVAIGTYGCIKTREDKHYFKEGLRAMMRELEPEIVLVYGAMPDEVFGEFLNMAKFVQYDDWTTRIHKGG